MKTLRWLETTCIAAELRASSFHARAGAGGVDLSVERDAAGRLTADSASAIVTALRNLAGSSSLLSRVKVVCAIGSRGLILRTISLPKAPAAEVPRLLQLQIESEFPLAPEALAWGWIPYPGDGPASLDQQTVLVAALKKETVEELTTLLKPISTDVQFTPAALARISLVPSEVRDFALLDVGPTQSELIVCASGTAPMLRLLPWGENQLGQIQSDTGPAIEGVPPGFKPRLPEGTLNIPLWLSGSVRGAARAAQLILTSDGGPEAIKSVDFPGGPGQTSAIVGINRLRPKNGANSLNNGAAAARPGRPATLLFLQSRSLSAADRGPRKLPRRPLALAAALLAAVLLLPYVEALVLQPRLAQRLAMLKASSTQLATIDREFSFLRYLEQHQAPHLDATFVIAQAAPQGVRLESVNINRQGEVSLTGWLRDLAQVGDFRLKLVNSGFFSSVVVEDQSPTQDRQRINFRINARWKDAAEREALTLGPELPDPGAAKTNTANLATNPPGPIRPPPSPP